MRLLIDAQLPPALTKWFADRGHDAVHVGDALGLAVADVAIADHVQARGLVLLSKDDDFLRLRFPDRFALVWLRCGNITNRSLCMWLDARWPHVERMLEDGERLIEVV